MSFSELFHPRPVLSTAWSPVPKGNVNIKSNIVFDVDVDVALTLALRQEPLIPLKLISHRDDGA